MIFDIPQRYNCHLSQYLSSILEWKSCDKVFTSDLSAGISFTGGLIKTLHCRDQVVCLIRATYTCVPCGKLFKIPIQLLVPMKKLNRKIKTTSSHLLIWHCKATVGKDHHKKQWHISPSLFHIYPCMTAFMPQSWVAEWEILGHIKGIKPQPLISQTTFIRVLLFSVDQIFLSYIHKYISQNLIPSIILPEHQNKCER